MVASGLVVCALEETWRRGADKELGFCGVCGCLSGLVTCEATVPA